MYYLSIKYSRDGFGTQLFNIIYGYFISKILNINYYFIPLERVGHNYENNKNYESDLNKFINYEKLLTITKIDKKISIYNLQELINYNFTLTNENILFIIEKRCLNIKMFVKDLNRKIIKPLTNIFFINKSNPFNDNIIHICIHIRSGDILFNIKKHKIRFIPIEQYKILISCIHNIFKDKKYKIHLFFEEKTNLGYNDKEIYRINKEIFNIYDLKDKNIVLEINNNLTDDFLKFIYADYFFMANSSFSNSAALLRKKNTYYVFNNINKFFWDKNEFVNIIDKPEDLNIS